jgi:hypothetical protein
VYENPETAVNHIVDALKQSILKKRIKDDLTFGHIDLRKDFLGFMRHVIRKAENYSDYEDPTDPHHKLGKSNSVTGQKLGLRVRVQRLVADRELPQQTLQTRSQARTLERVGSKTHRIV